MDETFPAWVLGVAIVGAALWWTLRSAGVGEPLHSLTDVLDRLFGGPHYGKETSSSASEASSPQTTAAGSSGPVQATQTALTWVTPPAGLAYQSDFDAATLTYMLPIGLLSRVAFQESGYDPTTVGRAGEIGIMQFMPDTARSFSIDPSIPSQAIDAAGHYLRQLFDEFRTWRLALTAYNWGPTNLVNYGINAVPATTRDYVQSIAGDLGL